MKKDTDHLYSQLVKLGDMIGDGLHLEPDGKWISREYKQVCKALGLEIGAVKRANNSERINEAMIQRVKEVPCSRCGGELKQTRSGSMRARCVNAQCLTIMKLLKATKRKKGGAA